MIYPVDNGGMEEMNIMADNGLKEDKNKMADNGVLIEIWKSSKNAGTYLCLKKVFFIEYTKLESFKKINFFLDN